ncbi:hypothetical protein H632_c169p0, partial [Helicosporidium sp. ATCC 50920]
TTLGKFIGFGAGVVGFAVFLKSLDRAKYYFDDKYATTYNRGAHAGLCAYMR